MDFAISHCTVRPCVDLLVNPTPLTLRAMLAFRRSQRCIHAALPTLIPNLNANYQCAATLTATFQQAQQSCTRGSNSNGKTVKVSI